MTDLNIILNDETVKPLSEAQKSTITNFVIKYNLLNNVTVYETIHGHIVHIDKNKNNYVGDKDGAARMTIDDMNFISPYFNADLIRWIELYNGKVVIGLGDR